MAIWSLVGDQRISDGGALDTRVQDVQDMGTRGGSKAADPGCGDSLGRSTAVLSRFFCSALYSGGALFSPLGIGP